jgi:hypothetical protein
MPLHDAGFACVRCPSPRNRVFGTQLTNIAAAVVVAGNYLQPAFKPDVDGSLPFYAGLLNALFVRHGIPVFTPDSLSKLVGDTSKPSIRSRAETEALCFPSVAQIGSHANRFSFKDSELPLEAALEGEPPLQSPLSSDAFAFRRAVFAPNESPTMRNKICYIARQVNRKRSFSAKAETTFRRILSRVASKTEASVSIVEAINQWRPATVRPLSIKDTAVLLVVVYALTYGDLSVLCVYMPNHLSTV